MFSSPCSEEWYHHLHKHNAEVTDPSSSAAVQQSTEPKLQHPLPQTGLLLAPAELLCSCFSSHASTQSLRMLKDCFILCYTLSSRITHLPGVRLQGSLPWKTLPISCLSSLSVAQQSVINRCQPTRTTPLCHSCP